MSERTLGLDPADFGTTGLTLGMLLDLALSEPERVLPRLRIFGRGGGPETMASWKLRAATELLRRHGVDLDTPLTLEGTTPVTDAHEPDDDLHQLHHQYHSELNTWTARLYYTMKTSDVYAVDHPHFHMEPRLADLHDVLDDALMDRDLAVGRRTMITLTTSGGFVIALEPTQIASIRVELIDPVGQQVLPVAPGSLEHTGPVERDENGGLK